MWGLEYALLFGVPNNKLELIDGRSRCAFPFLSREQAEAHFAAWTETLCRWQGWSQPPAVRQGPRGERVEVNGFALELAPRPIDLRIPLDGDTFLTFHRATWRRDLWGGQPPGKETGWDHFLGHQDVQMNLWGLFGTFCERYGGRHSGRVGLVLSDTAAVEPDQYYFGKDRADCMIAGDYFHGIPDLIAEVLSPASRQIDRGSRKDLYGRSGVPHLWLLDPELETLETYELAGRNYRLTATWRPGAEFRPPLFPDVAVDVDRLFQTQLKRHGRQESKQDLEPEAEPIPEWLVPEEERLGLEYLFLLGHPERRWEIWNNRAPCVLPFGSRQEATARFTHFLEDVSRWEQAALPPSRSVGPDVDQAEAGRFRLTRRGRHVHLDVAVDARKYRQLLEVWTRREAWDWGEK